ncbi:purine nucleosidase [Thalassobacillus cyri]|uniref:Purine nucleosidase n=1 Tax=Thalassobacillus cyri TaxID=571932 RepID=A0A1H4AKY2_9BACI|nr:nucleoside hydrolase [Thalassobacillus cyri]SEA36431.1 purine nucleosidase [Thalassobacillus cyri]
MTNQTNVILDCDPGHDDAIAIIMAASNANLNIEAITTVAGNVSVDKTTLNAQRICDLIDLKHVPLAKGANRPLVKRSEIAEEIHGDSGLDGPQFPDHPTKTIEKIHAADLIIDKILTSDKPITLVPTGPLTNIALAMLKEPAILPKIKEIVLMGGGTYGNWTPAAEFNIYVDAEAAKVVFESGVPLTMFGLDITHQAQATTSIIDDLAAIKNPVADTVVELLDFFKHTYQEYFGFDGAPIHDACTVAYLINPSIFDFKHVHVDIETKGEYSYGMTCVDLLGVTGKEPNVHFAHNIDQEKFWNLLKESLDSY